MDFKPPIATAWILPIGFILGFIVPFLFVPITCSPAAYWSIVLATWFTSLLLDATSDILFLKLHKNKQPW